MANINLGNIFPNAQNKISAVDTKVRLNKLSDEQKVVYADVKFDLAFSDYTRKELNAEYSNNDLQKVVNEEAVITSLRNILNTSMYTRLLNPDISFDMRSFLFEPLTEAKAYFMGYTLLNTLPSLEPRVKVENIKIGIDVLESCYEVSLTVSIPSLSTTISLGGILNSDGYSLYN